MKTIKSFFFVLLLIIPQMVLAQFSFYVDDIKLGIMHEYIYVDNVNFREFVNIMPLSKYKKSNLYNYIIPSSIIYLPIRPA